MSNNPQADLIYALLTLDSYNRGYGSGITKLSDDSGTHIGNFTITSHTNDEAIAARNSAYADGFYAIAYQSGDQTVISYRGTDTNFDKTDSGAGGSDLTHGYGMALGLTPNQPATDQSQLAAQFYADVTGGREGAAASNVTLVGHSLGGGLAGYVGAVAGTQAVVFDNMPFALAALNRAGEIGVTAHISDVRGYFTEGEFLQPVRAGDFQGIVGGLLAGVPGLGPIIAAYGVTLGTQTAILEGQVQKDALHSNYLTLNPLDVFSKFHSMALLTSLLWNRAYGDEKWVPAAQQLWGAYFDAGVAAALPDAQARTKAPLGSADNTLRTAIAYSALPVGEGERPFGDTAIWSMFSDAGDLGQALTAANGSGFLNDSEPDGGTFLGLATTKKVSQMLADMLVQYAGALALGNISQAMKSGTGGNDVRQGMLAYGAGAGGGSGVLSVDLSGNMWTTLLGKAVTPIEGVQFRDAFFKDAAGSAFPDAIRALGFKSADDLAQKMWGAKDASVINRFDLATGTSGGAYTIASRNYATTTGIDVDIFVGTTGNEHVTGTEGGDILVGHGGADFMDAGAGNDVVVASGDRNAKTIGGLGQDRIYNTSVGGEIWGDVYNSELDLSEANGHYDQRYYVTMEEHPNGISTAKINYIADDSSNADYFIWSGGTTIKDPQYHDRLFFFGIPLIGGNDTGGMVGTIFSGLTGGLATGALALAQGRTKASQTVYTDDILPFITYKMVANAYGGYDLHVSNILTAFVDAFEALTGDDESGLDQTLKRYLGTMSIEDFVSPKDAAANNLPVAIGGANLAALKPGKLGLTFKKTDPRTIGLAFWAALDPFYATAAGGVNAPLVDEALTASYYARKYSSALKWTAANDPLVLDLTGLGLETAGLAGSNVHFDFGNDLFAERTGWLQRQEGFLVLDRNGNGRIDDGTEMFGVASGSGFADLAAYDGNHDRVINALDAAFPQLQVWVDANGDGVTDAGELHTLADLGIVSLSLNAIPLDATTGDGTALSAVAGFTRSDGSSGAIYQALFQTDETDTAYRGESGHPAWAPAIDIKGFGALTNLAVATANDPDFAALVTARAAQMTTPDLRTLVAQAGDVLGQWGEAQPLTRELAPVLVSADGKTLVDRAVYVEDAAGGYWTLASHHAVLDAGGNAVARPTMEQVLAQATTAGAHWQLEQMWSPTSRGAALHARTGAPYLVQVVDGRAMVLDHGVQQADGSWRLASGTAILDANGSAIAHPTLSDVLAQGHAAGTEWRTEALGYNALANIPVQNIGIDIVNGSVADYTVQITDQDGTFYVWARNLDRALALQAKQGNARAFNLRNYAVDFTALQQQVNATDDSAYRIELLTPAEFNFALEMSSIAFEPQMLSASIDNGTGIISYSVNFSGQASLSSTSYVSGITQAIGLLDAVMKEYVTASRAMAVRMALQGGLSAFAHRGRACDGAPMWRYRHALFLKACRRAGRGYSAAW
ncbi:MAG TPA: hypothetical protein VGC56_10380 [Allosphingosinicella sp.]|jgi:hypothetical protein